jgi:hypothetical protein
MNHVGEVIDHTEIIKSCRELNPNETLAQLQMNRAKFVCWGATAFTVDNPRKPRMLRFKVSGMKHKGHVYVFLNGADLYDVYITTTRGTILEKSEGSHGGLYFDMLTDWIDDRVEKQDDYRF